MRVVDDGGPAAADGHRPVRACLLGPVRLLADGVEVPLPPPARDLLGVLALRPGETVLTEQIGTALWTVPRQRGAGPRLPAAIDALAAALAAAGCPELLGRGPDGLVLRLPGRAVDASRFGHLLRRARELMAAGDLAGASARFASALRLWQVDLDDDPLSGSAVNPLGWVQAERTRLVQMRAAAVEDRWECVLRRVAAALTAAGAPAADPDAVAAGAAALTAAEEAVADLERALDRHPLRERLWELLLTATAFARGRRAAAAVYDRAVLAVADNLGVEPGRRLGEIAAQVRSGGLATWWERPEEPCPAPPPTTAPARTGLPVPLTPLIGRDRLAGRVTAHLAEHRLVTLTGPGGSGKTRLAVAVATDRAPVWFVDLSVVDDAAAVATAVAVALGVRDEPGRATGDTLADALGAGDGLLLLDNCEHVVAGAAELVAVLLERCPVVRVLATSRVALRVPGEVTVPVPPLSGPAPEGEHTIAGLAAHPASRLFLERARARAGRPVPESDAAAVAMLCAELDGLPLAIELAAARTPVLSVPEIVARLRADHSVLRSPDPTAPARHRTVAAAVESSVDQLDPVASQLFDRLAVFAGGFDAEAAAAVAGRDAAEGLAALVEASLVEAQPDARFRMLVPIHRHALGRLRAAGSEEAARQAHARHFLALAERADGGLRGSAQGWWLGRLRREAANLRAAMAWLAGAGAADEPHGDLRLAGVLANYCRLEGYYRDGRTWLVDALARHPDAPATLRARALAGAAMLAMLLCDYPAAARHAAQAWAACRAAGDPLGEARVELTLGSVARERAEYRASAAHLDAAARLFGMHGDEWGATQSTLLRGFTAWLATDLDRAEAKLRAALDGFERLGDPEAAATVLMNLGAVALYRGDGDRAASLLDTALDRFTALAFPEGLGWAHNLRGLVELRAGRTGRAVAHLTRSLATHRQVGDRWRTASVLEALAEAARVVGAGERGAALLGAAATIRTELGAPVPACELHDLAATAAGLRTLLGEDAYAKAHAAGRVAGIDTLVGEPAELSVPALPAAEPS
ncbi:BTAD domain-containing putative transcriptional regulator [Asanoa sp. WMMD1127]|uniref:AfsR/SARP family transcriptional regulator n=1 Tax=Asanoa sp. WMMD1127 TaxID=3016107 RepID=UPI002416C7CE|nr:BTAD domain-containing putative transcriptional regulator [Asanoa sp. WMMD1127]MDG4827018.1 BTAD domain-containing putative transcriptional regulator [Asanoa sp. WMMD1127]